MSRNWSLSVDEDIDRYTREEEGCTCYYCKRILKNERVYNFHGTYYCVDCFDEQYGEEV